MQRPSISPVIEARRQLNSIETRGHIGDDPEDQPHGRPRLPNHHRHVLARQPQRNHPHPVNHPEHHKRALTICIRISDAGVHRARLVAEGDLECQGDERVGQGHEEIGDNGGDPAPDDELLELERRVARRSDKLHMDGEEEGEREEGEDDKIDEADGDGGNGLRRAKRPQIELREADGRAEGLRCPLQVAAQDAAVAEHLGRPHLAELGRDLRLEGGQLRRDVRRDGVLVAGFDVDDLAGSERVVRGVARLHGLLEERGGVGVDHDCGPGLVVEHGSADRHRVVVEGRGWKGAVSEVRRRISHYSLRCLRDHRPYQRSHASIWCLLAIEIHHVDNQRGQVGLDVE